MYGQVLYALVPYATFGNDSPDIDLPEMWIDICPAKDLWEDIRRKINLTQDCKEK